MQVRREARAVASTAWTAGQGQCDRNVEAARQAEVARPGSPVETGASRYARCRRAARVAGVQGGAAKDGSDASGYDGALALPCRVPVANPVAHRSAKEPTTPAVAAEDQGLPTDGRAHVLLPVIETTSHVYRTAVHVCPGYSYVYTSVYVREQISVDRPDSHRGLLNISETPIFILRFRLRQELVHVY